MSFDANAKPLVNQTRRVLLGGGAFILVAGGVFASKWFNVFADVASDGTLSVQAAYEQALAGKIYLIDIRRPDEWVRSGVAVPAIPLDMRRDDFETVLQSVIDRSGKKPVALICARGVRSNRMNARLERAGFTDVWDVPEGMLGSGAGTGYIKQALPLRRVSAQELEGAVAL
jgi:rhodanese-related sulfurtransferase